MPERQEHTPPDWVDRAIAVTEDVVYGVLAIVLVGGAAILIGEALGVSTRSTRPPTGMKWASGSMVNDGDALPEP